MRRLDSAARMFIKRFVHSRLVLFISPDESIQDYRIKSQRPSGQLASADLK